MSGAEQRKSVRYSCILEASFEGVGQIVYRPPLLARVMNISAGGFGVHAGVQFAAGTLLTVELRGTKGKSRVQARVAHVSRQENGTCIMGAEFSRPLSTQELEQLLA